MNRDALALAKDLFPNEWPMWARYVRNAIMSFLVLAACAATGFGVFWAAGGLREQGVRDAGVMQVLTLPLVGGIAAAAIGALFFIDRVLLAHVWQHKQTLVDEELGEISSVRPNHWHFQTEIAPGAAARLSVESDLTGAALLEQLRSVARNVTSKQLELRTAAARILQTTDWTAKYLESICASTSEDGLQDQLILRRVLFARAGFQADFVYPQQGKFAGWVISMLFTAHGELAHAQIRPNY